VFDSSGQKRLKLTIGAYLYCQNSSYVIPAEFFLCFYCNVYYLCKFCRFSLNGSKNYSVKKEAYNNFYCFLHNSC
jgi:hypothetical protein